MEPEDAALSAFRHYRAPHRVVSWVSRRLFAQVTYRQRHGLIRGMKRKGGLGFIPRRALTREEVFLESLPLQGKTVYDIGAFEGLLTLFFARRADRVIAFEPNPANALRCAENLKLNALANVRLVEEGVSDKPGEAVLNMDLAMPGGGSAHPLIGRQIQLQARHTRSIPIRVLPLDGHFAQKRLPPPDLVKIDIEGLEYAALCGMRSILVQRHQDLYIELHGATLQEKIANYSLVFDFLDEYGYSIYDVERGVTCDVAGETCPSHIFCAASQSVQKRNQT
ncbi:MAG TPA: FkbM family methyltransferase [Bryobacteraceae bacterium]